MSFQDSCDSIQDLAGNFGFASYFNHLLKTKTSVDVTFILETPDGDVEISAHQLVLAMRSAYFADMFYDDQKEKEKKIIRFEKINPKTFEDMIRYCYDCNPCLETFQEICTLFRVAYQFKMISLMNICRTHLLDIEIMPGNVFSILEVSEYMGDNKLRDRCYSFLQKKTKDVMESYKMAQVTPAMVRIILELPKLSLHSEIELLKWVFDWANAKIEDGDTNCINTREYLQDLLQDMNFLSLTFEEFSKLCKDYPDFFTSEEIASIYLNIAHPGTREMPVWNGKEVKIREYVGLRAKLIHKYIVETGKCIADIFALELILKHWMEMLKCCSERIQNLVEKDCDPFQDWLEFDILLKHFELCYEICIQLSKIAGKDEVLERLEKIHDKDKETMKEVRKYFHAIFVTLQGGGLKYLLENETELKKAFENDEYFEKFKTNLATYGEPKRKMLWEMLQNNKEYQRMKKILENVEELDIVKILENIHVMYKTYEECDTINDISKEMHSLVIDRIRWLSEEYFEILKKFERLIDEYDELLS